jgi:hypothetical protein
VANVVLCCLALHAISAAAYEATAAKLPFGSVGGEHEYDANGDRQIGLSPASSIGSRLCAGRARATAT